MTDIFRDKSSNLFDKQIQTLLGPKEKEKNEQQQQKRIVRKSSQNHLKINCMEIKENSLYVIKAM